MEPSNLANRLRHIASKIERSKNPSKSAVYFEINNLLKSITSSTKDFLEKNGYNPDESFTGVSELLSNFDDFEKWINECLRELSQTGRYTFDFQGFNMTDHDAGIITIIAIPKSGTNMIPLKGEISVTDDMNLEDVRNALSPDTSPDERNGEWDSVPTKK